MTEPSFQERMESNHCWGCGPNNESGLRLASFWSGEEAVAAWSPSPEHMAGPEHILNGGIIATLLDCHTICTAMADAYRAAGREIGEGETIWYVTASLELTYLAPAPISEPVRLVARVVERAGKKTLLEGELSSAGKTRATSKTVAVRVTSDWLEDQAC